jgi:hypothetical protein
MSWESVLDADTPAAQLPMIAWRIAEATIANARTQLERNHALTPEMKTASLAAIAPTIRQSTLDQITTAWLRLQPEAGRLQ